MVTNLFVGNLPFSIGEEEIKQLFSEAGVVVSVKLIKDQVTGTSRGFAFVEMENTAGAEKAVKELDGRLVGDRTIGVREAYPKAERQDNRGASGWSARGGNNRQGGRSGRDRGDKRGGNFRNRR